MRKVFRTVVAVLPVEDDHGLGSYRPVRMSCGHELAGVPFLRFWVGQRLVCAFCH